MVSRLTNAAARRLRPLLRRVAGAILPSQRRARHLERDRQRGYESLMRSLLQDARVRSGPFAGMRYIQEPFWGHLGPLLTGAYESELHDALERFIARGCDTVIDVGCAEGYYVAGLARRLPAATVHGFDIDVEALARCRQMVELNHVGDRVFLHGACTPDQLQELIYGRTLLIIDCEGQEIDLLTPERAPGLERADLLVEFHDFIDPTISSRLISRFAQTHEVKVIDVQPRDPRHFPDLAGWPPSIQAMVLDERRPVDPHPMQWGLFLSRSGSPSELLSFDAGAAPS